MCFLCDETVPPSIAGLPSRKALAGCGASWRTVRAHLTPLLVIPTLDFAARTKGARKVTNLSAESENVENNGFVVVGVRASSSPLSELQPNSKLGHTSPRTSVGFFNRSQRPPFAFYEIIRIFGCRAQVKPH